MSIRGGAVGWPGTQADYEQTDETKHDFIKNKPDLDIYLKKSGGSMTGNLNIGGNQLMGVPTPTAEQHAANKKYVDSEVKTALQDAKAYADDVASGAASGSSSTLESAKEYADQVGADTLSSAKSYTDGKKKTLTVSLSTSGWSSKSQSVTASGVTSSNTVIVAPDPGSLENYCNAKVYCSAQASNKLTFKCDTVPTAALTVNVIILN